MRRLFTRRRRRNRSALSDNLELVFPVHPRTRQRWSTHLQTSNPLLRIIDPLGSIEFLALQKHAQVVITDSGGIQEETTFLGIPCLTLRENTERPVTTTLGTDVLIGRDWDLLRREFNRARSNGHQRNAPPPLWDGRASKRIAEILSR